jgi:hypothetical protein
LAEITRMTNESPHHPPLFNNTRQQQQCHVQ